MTGQSSGRSAKSFFVFLYHFIPDTGCLHLSCMLFRALLCDSSPFATISFKWLSCAFITSSAVFPQNGASHGPPICLHVIVFKFITSLECTPAHTCPQPYTNMQSQQTCQIGTLAGSAYPPETHQTQAEPNTNCLRSAGHRHTRPYLSPVHGPTLAAARDAEKSPAPAAAVWSGGLSAWQVLGWLSGASSSPSGSPPLQGGCGSGMAPGP
jgi:hypothetical protein